MKDKKIEAALDQSEYVQSIILKLFDLLETKAEIVFYNKEVESVCSKLDIEMQCLESAIKDIKDGE